MHKLFFDVTDLRFYLTHAHRLSGIQRVTVMVIQKAARRLGKENVWLAFIDDKSQKYLCIRYDDLGTDNLSSLPALSAALGVIPAETGHRPTMQRYADKPMKRAFHSAVRDFNAAIGNKRHFEKRYTSIEAWKESAVSVRNAESGQDKRFRDFFETSQSGDHLVLLDASWGNPRAGVAHRQAHQSGVKVYSLIHDLIPVTSPQFLVGQQGLKFHNWLHGTLDYVDVYIANSKATCADLETFLSTYKSDRPVYTVPLAQEGIPISLDDRPVPDSLAPVDRDAYPLLFDGYWVDEHVRAMLKRPYVLCVGTIEARKNTWSIVQAWERMRAQGVLGLPRLVFAGRPGWLNSDFDRFMNASGYLGGWVEILHGPSDEELDFLYRNCLFTIFTSYKEGWGLPIGESLGYGKTAVVSGVSSMPEVGGDFVEYCDPLSIASIEEACRKLIEYPEHREALERKIAATRLRSWDDVASDLISVVEADHRTEATRQAS